jgi:hypothetical protein
MESNLVTWHLTSQQWTGLPLTIGFYYLDIHPHRDRYPHFGGDISHFSMHKYPHFNRYISTPTDI